MSIIGEPSYYTPDISELHPGFEFEFYEGIEDDVNDLQWRSAKISTRQSRLEYQPNSSDKEILEDILFDYSYYLDLPDTTRLRVKYLDEEDVLSLGFNKEGVPRYNDVTDIIDGYSLYLNKTDDLYLHLIEGNRYAIYLSHEYNEMSGNWEQIDLYNGLIMNKSELIKLLEKLNIEHLKY